MKSMIAILMVCACCITSVAAAPATTQAISGTDGASRRIRIVWTGTGPSWDALGQVISRHAAESAPRLLGLPSDSTSRWFKAEPVIADHWLEVPLQVTLPEDEPARPAAKEFLDDMVDVIRKAVQADYDEQHFNQINPLKEERAQAAMELDGAEHRVNELRAQMRKLTGRSEISTKTIGDTATALEDESTKLELDILAKTARRDALAKEIADQSAKVQQKVAGDAIAGELQKVVEARESQVERVKQLSGQGQATAAAVSDAVGQAAEARAKLLERQRDAALDAGGDVVAALNRELSTLSVDLRELTARLEFVQARLPGLRDATDLLDTWDRAQRNESRAQSDLDSLIDEVRLLNRRFAAMQPPRVFVVESFDSATTKPSAAP